MPTSTLTRSTPTRTSGMPWHPRAPVSARHRRHRRRRHPQDRVVATLDVREHVFEGTAWRAPPVVAAGGVVARGRRGRSIVGGELAFVPAPEEVIPRDVVVGEESRLRVLLIAEGFDHSVDRGIEGIASHWRRRDRDAPRAQASASGRAEVRRRRVARHVQQPPLLLV
jgi:hypothetical protein